MKIKQYKKALDLFRAYYTQKIIDFQKQLGGTDEIPKWSDDEMESIAKAAGSSLFYFFDENDIFVSILYGKDKTYNYDIIDGIANSVSESYSKRMECEFAAIEEGFKILNEK